MRAKGEWAMLQVRHRRGGSSQAACGDVWRAGDEAALHVTSTDAARYSKASVWRPANCSGATPCCRASWPTLVADHWAGGSFARAATKFSTASSSSSSFAGVMTRVPVGKFAFSWLSIVRATTIGTADLGDELNIRLGIAPKDPTERRAFEARLAQRRAEGGERAASLQKAEEEKRRSDERAIRSKARAAKRAGKKDGGG
jgi:hypothetical protein